MYMKLNVESLKQQRELRAWTQSHLAQVADLSLRTIQRIENSGFASPESTKAICAAFEINVSDLLSEPSDSEDKLKESTSQPKANVSSILVATGIAFIIAFLLSYYLS